MSKDPRSGSGLVAPLRLGVFAFCFSYVIDALRQFFLRSYVWTELNVFAFKEKIILFLTASETHFKKDCRRYL